MPIEALEEHKVIDEAFDAKLLEHKREREARYNIRPLSDDEAQEAAKLLAGGAMFRYCATPSLLALARLMSRYELKVRGRCVCVAHVWNSRVPPSFASTLSRKGMAHDGRERERAGG